MIFVGTMLMMVSLMETFIVVDVIADESAMRPVVSDASPGCIRKNMPMPTIMDSTVVNK